MRAKMQGSGLTVQLIAGTNTVLLAMDMDDATRKGCLGFAIQRTDHTEDERAWMRGQKVFEATGGGVAAGDDASSRDQPFQAFQWCDYTAKPEHDYTYRVVPLYGTPEALQEGAGVSVKISTEPHNDGTHGVYFNRGACSSQAYAKKFKNKAPNKVGQAAYDWLSRGLLEGLVSFIERAKDGDYALHGAIYEFQWPEVLDALHAAKSRGAKLKIVFDAIPGDTHPKEKNLAAIATAKLKQVSLPKTRGTIMHNKFLVLSRKDKPVAVWTGSTNWTENGIFGHSNCGHIIEDALIAAQYLDYWTQLSGDEASEANRNWMDANAPNPPSPWTEDVVAVFSPRNDLSVLEWYAKIAGSAKSALFMTFAFGMNKLFLDYYENDDEILKYALMEKEGNGRQLAQGKIDIRRVRARTNVIVAVANELKLNVLDRWVTERRSLSNENNVKWIHTKYALVDPLGPKPVVITGSANFSKASTDSNDENMLVIRNNKRLAEIYLTEFMRLHSHYAFREAVKIARERGEDFEAERAYLIPDDSWQHDHYKKGGVRWMRRGYFVGSK
jgi:phosphatidylserine/phosphatidylglycerophosphate/cardiolipin synthase-like enzyme